MRTNTETITEEMDRDLKQTYKDIKKWYTGNDAEVIKLARQKEWLLKHLVKEKNKERK